MTVDDPVAPLLGQEDADTESVLDAVFQDRTPPSLAQFGFKQLTDDDLDAGFASLDKPKDFGEEIAPTTEDIPFLGVGFSLEKMLDVKQAQARMKAGRATVDDEREVFRWMVDQARTKTRGGSFADIAKQFVSFGTEFVAGAGVARAGTAVARKGLGVALRRSLRESAEEAVRRKAMDVAQRQLMETGVETAIGKALAKDAATAAAALGTTWGLQEAVPRAAGATGLPTLSGLEGGAWSAQAVRSVFGKELTPDEIQDIIEARDAVLPTLLNKGGGLVEGALRQAIEVGTEATGGLLRKLPPFAAVDYVVTGLFSRLAGRASKVGWLKAAAEAAHFHGPGGETAETYASDVLTAAIWGDQSIVEAAAGVTKILPELVLASSVPGLAGALGARVRLEMKKADQRAAAKVADTLAGEPAPEAPAAKGGGPTQVAPEAPAEGAAAVEVTDEEREADIEKFRAAVPTGRVEFARAEPETPSDLRAQKFLRRLGVEATFVDAPEGVDRATLPPAFYPGENRAVLVRGTDRAAGYAIHEALHTWETQQAPERRQKLSDDLRAIDPAFMAEVESWTKQQPMYQGVKPEVLAEEIRANTGTFLGELVPFLETPEGGRLFTLAYAKDGGPLRRVIGAAYDWLQQQVKFLPESARQKARALLRAGKAGKDPALVAQRFLDALKEIRPALRQAAPAAAEAPQETGEAPLTDEGGVREAPAAAPAAPAQPTARPARTREERLAEREQRRAEAKAANVPLPGDTVEYMHRSPNGATIKMTGRVLETTGSGANTRLRIRYMEDVARAGESRRSAGENRGRRAASEIVVDRNRVRLVKKAEAIDSTSRTAKNRARAEEEQRGGAEPRFAAAYHGSPHEFDKFSTSKIGSGEGEQVYGWGLYYGSRREVGERFKADAAERTGSGYGYKVDLAPPEDTYLVWNVPFDQQSQHVRDALTKALPKDMVAAYRGDPRQNGARIYWDISNALLYGRLPLAEHPEDGAYDRETSLWLLRHGIRGNKYPEHVDRASGAVNYNYVIFDENDVKIEERFAARLKGSDKLYASFLDAAQITSYPAKFGRLASDEFLALDRWERAMRALGAGGDAGPTSAVRRYFGRLANRGEGVQRVKRRVERMLRRHKISLDDAGTYAEAQHTREAREHFHQLYLEREQLKLERKALRKAAEDDPNAARDLANATKRIDELDYVAAKIPEGVSVAEYWHEHAEVTGYKTSEAEAILDKLKDNPGYADLRQELRTLRKQTLDGMLADQLITEETHETWLNQFQDYVPLRTAEVGRPEGPRSSGFTVRGPESKRRKGRKTVADNPFVMSFIQARKAIERGEKNAVGLELRQFLMDNKELVDALVEEREPELDSKGRPVLTDTAFYLKVKGRDTIITLQNPDLARALKRLGLPHIPGVLRFMQTMMTSWKLMATGLNPNFWLDNFLRDVPTAWTNVSDVATKYGQGGLRREMNRSLGQSVRTIWQAARERTITTGLGDYYQEYRENGGAIGSFGSTTFEELEQDFAKGLSQAPLRQVGRALAPAWQVVQDINQAIEGANRFALFVALRKRGVGAKDAALEARRLTVDFSQKGEWGSIMSLFYAFFSASVGGTRRMYEALRDSKGARVIVGTYMGLGLMQALVMPGLSDDDEDGQKLYDKIPEGEKRRYMHFVIPGHREPFKLPLAWGLNFFHTFGRLAGELGTGKKKMADAGEALMVSALTAFSPINTPWPTAMAPFMEIRANENFMGAPITPPANPYEPDMPDYQRHFRATPPWAIWLAKQINDISGGDEVRPGAIDVSGDEIEHLAAFAGAGAARFIERSFELGRNLAAGTPMSETLKAAPFIRSVYGARTDFVDSSNFYGALDEIAYQKKEIKLAQEGGDTERVKALRERYGPFLALEKRGDRVAKQAKGLRDEAYQSSPPDRAKLKEANLLMQRWYRDWLLALAGTDG